MTERKKFIGAELPSVSTFALIFRRNGLIRPKRRKRKTPPFSAPLAHAKAPNAVWCIDFKGHFAVGSTRCYPLTITDADSAISSPASRQRQPNARS